MINTEENSKTLKLRRIYLVFIIVVAIISIWLSIVVSWGAEEDYYQVSFWAIVLLSLFYLLADFLFFSGLKGWKKALTVILSIVLILAGSEYFTRTFMNLYPRLYTPSPALIWENTPNLNAVKDENRGFTVTTDSHGFRNDEISQDKKPGQFRIMVLGDSTAFGWPLDDRENFSYQLEKDLKRTLPGKDFRVINAAVSGYSSLQGKMLFDQQGWDFKPDLLIIAFNNDPFIDVAEDKDRLPSGKSLSLKKHLSKSALYLSMKRLFFHSRINPEDDVIIPQGKGKPRISPDDLNKIYSDMLSEAGKRGVKVMVVSLPLRGRARDFPGVAGYRETMKKTAEDNGALFVDLMKEWDNSISGVLFADDIHPDAKGHKIIAGRLSEIIQDKNLPGMPALSELKQAFDYYYSGKRDKAAGLLNKIKAENPYSYKVYSGLGKVDFKNGNLDSALASFTEALKLNPGNPDILNDIGAVYHRRKNFDEAIPHFKKAVEINPLFYPACDNLGFAYYYKGEYETALDWFNKSVELNPSFADSYMGRGKVYLENGDQDRALTNLTKAIELDNTLADAYFTRGLIYADSLVYEKALSDLNRAAQLNPDDPAAFFERSIVHYWNGDFKETLNDIETALTKGKDKNSDFHREIIQSGFIYIVKGLALLKMNLEKEGARDIRKGLAMFSRQEEGVNFILPAHGALFLKDYKKALDWFNREPDHAKHKYYGRALAYMGLGMKDKAGKDLEKSAEFLPESWERNEVMTLLSKKQDGGYK